MRSSKEVQKYHIGFEDQERHQIALRLRSKIL